VRDGLGIPEITARRLLERMAHDGLIVFEGEPGQGSYQRVVAEH
jgi:DNA-binding transcriptional regulator PaaX